MGTRYLHESHPHRSFLTAASVPTLNMYFVPRRCSLQCCRMTRQSGHYIIHTALGLLLAAGSSSAFIATKGAAPVLTQQCTKLKCSRISIESRSRSPPRKRSSELRARQRASDPPGGLTSSDFSRETLQILNDMLERVESKATEPPLAAFDAVRRIGIFEERLLGKECIAASISYPEMA